MSSGVIERYADALADYERRFGGPGLSAPCRGAGADYWCPECERDVRSITDGERTMVCPICGGMPGMLAIGYGPKDVEGSE